MRTAYADLILAVRAHFIGNPASSFSANVVMIRRALGAAPESSNLRVLDFPRPGSYGRSSGREGAAAPSRDRGRETTGLSQAPVSNDARAATAAVAATPRSSGLCWYGPPAETSEIQSEGRTAERRRDEEGKGADQTLPPAPGQPRRPAAAEWRGRPLPRRRRAERDEGQDAAQFAPAQHRRRHEDGAVERKDRSSRRSPDRDIDATVFGSSINPDPAAAAFSVSASGPTIAQFLAVAGIAEKWPAQQEQGAGADVHRLAGSRSRDRLGGREVLDEFVEAAEDDEALGQALACAARVERLLYPAAAEREPAGSARGLPGRAAEPAVSTSSTRIVSVSAVQRLSVCHCERYTGSAPLHSGRSYETVRNRE